MIVEWVGKDLYPPVKYAGSLVAVTQACHAPPPWTHVLSEGGTDRREGFGFRTVAGLPVSKASC